MFLQNLDTEAGVLEYLRQQDFSASKFDFRSPYEIEKLKGGITNFTYRLNFTDLSAAHSSGRHNITEPDPQYAILKFAAEYATSDPDTPFSSERQLYEVRAMQEIVSALASQPEGKPGLIKIPELYYFDENAHVIIMEDLSPPTSSPTEHGQSFISLEKMCQNPIFTNALEIADQVGVQIGHFLFGLHRSTDFEAVSTSTTIRELFSPNEISKEIDVQTCLRDVPKKLKEFGVILKTAERSRLEKVIADVVTDYLQRPQSVIMGDFWAGNIILELSGTLEQKVLESISIIDWEFATCAPSYVDLAHFLSEIWLQDRFFPGPSPAARVNQQVAIAAFRSYKSFGGLIDRQKLATYVGGHACCFLNFVDWNTEDGVKRAVAEQGVMMMLQADAGDWDELFKMSPLLGTLLE